MRNHASQMLNGAQDKRISMLKINSLPIFRALVSKKVQKNARIRFRMILDGPISCLGRLQLVFPTA